MAGLYKVTQEDFLNIFSDEILKIEVGERYYASKTSEAMRGTLLNGAVFYGRPMKGVSTTESYIQILSDEPLNGSEFVRMVDSSKTMNNLYVHWNLASSGKICLENLSEYETNTIHTYKITSDVYMYNSISDYKNATYNIGMLKAGAEVTANLIYLDGSNTTELNSKECYLKLTCEQPINGAQLCTSGYTYGAIVKWYTNTLTDNTMKNIDQVSVYPLSYVNDASEQTYIDALGNERNKIDDIPTVEVQSSIEEMTIDNEFLKSYGTYYQSPDDYDAGLNSGLNITDMRGIIGLPQQFSGITDPRIDGTTDDISLGRVYSSKVLDKIPLLLITPGTPKYMSTFSKKQKDTIMETFLKPNGIDDTAATKLINSKSGKYYSLQYDYVSYFKYVNVALRAASYYLKIQDEKLDDVKLSEFNWMYIKGRNDDGSSIYGSSNLLEYLGTYAGAIPFYVDLGNSVDDSFSNETTTSTVAQGINSLSEQGREINFVTGNVSGMTGLEFDKFTSAENLQSNIQNVQDEINSILGRNSILTSIINKAQTVLAGGKMVFPEIWSDSTFSGRSFTCRMKLVCCSGDKLDQYLHLLVPMYFLIGMTAARQSAAQAYYSPFIIRAYYKGLFNIDMGIITDLSITKGDEGSWTPNGMPTVMEISFTIKDLYNNLFISDNGENNNLNILDGGGIFSNIAELDYIANSCGININETEILRTIKMWMTFNVKNRITDTITMDMFGKIAQNVNNKILQVFSKFR